MTIAYFPHSPEAKQTAYSLAQPLPVITTKLVPPRVAGTLLARPRLLARLQPAAGQTLALVSAGAGFGKTTLLAQWHQALIEQGRAVAWLSLDATDDSAETFCRYLLHALAAAHPHLQSALAPWLTQSPPLAALPGYLINALQAFAAPLYLIIDDYHYLQLASLHQPLLQLLTHAPPGLHVVLGSRVVPPFPLSRLRAYNQLVEIDTHDLRFNLQEVQHYFADSPALAGNGVQLQRLLVLTEGWITGLQMARLSPSMQSDPQCTLDSLGRTGRLVERYLHDVVFDTLPVEVNDFLLQTSILERFSAALGEAVTGLQDGQVMLDWIERHNLFIAALDEQGEWFRYHHLFAETLQARLRRRPDLNIPELHERASHWLARHNLWAEAIHHALLAGKLDCVPEHADSGAQSLAEQGDVDTLLRWLEPLPLSTDEHRIGLQLNLAWALAHRFRFAEARRLLGCLRQWFDLHPARRDWRIKLDTVEAICEVFAENTAHGLARVTPLLAQLPSGDRWVDGLVCNILSYAHLIQGRPANAQAVQQQMPCPSSPTENLFVSVYQAFVLAQSHIRQGDLHTGETYLRQALEYADRLTGAQSIGSATLAALLAELAGERGDWAHLTELVTPRLAAIDGFTPLDSVLGAYRALIRQALHADDPGRAQVLLQHALQIAAQRQWPRLQAALLLEHVRVQLRRDDMAGAELSVAQMRTLPHTEQAMPGVIHYVQMAQAQLWQARHHYTRAAELWGELVSLFEQHGALLESARLRSWHALALWQADQPSAAVAAWLPALRLGQREHLCFSLIDAGTALIPLLQRCLTDERTGLRPYLLRLGEQLGGESATLERLSLSEREVQTLQLLAVGQSNKEIARSLDISAETVKWHLKNLYGKLQVASRTQAMSRARALSLLE